MIRHNCVYCINLDRESEIWNIKNSTTYDCKALKDSRTNEIIFISCNEVNPEGDCIYFKPRLGDN